VAGAVGVATDDPDGAVTRSIEATPAREPDAGASRDGAAGADGAPDSRDADGPADDGSAGSVAARVGVVPATRWVMEPAPELMPEVISDGAPAAVGTAGGGATPATEGGTTGTPAPTPSGSAGRATRLRAQPVWVARMFAPPNVDGPRARLGFVWFVLLLPATFAGAVATALLFGAVALVAALQTAQAWAHRGYRSSRLVAAAIVIAVAVTAPSSYVVPGIILIAAPMLALGAATIVPANRRRISVPASAGITLRAALPGALATAGAVFSVRVGLGAAVVFVLLVSAYDLGCFVFGAESARPAMGLMAGAACTMAAITPVWAFQLPPFDGSAVAFVYAGLVAVCAPLGQMAASLALPRASTWVPALRRIDAYVVAGLLWAWGIWHYLS
jgi:hypothetical protein